MRSSWGVVRNVTKISTAVPGEYSKVAAAQAVDSSSNLHSLLEGNFASASAANWVVCIPGNKTFHKQVQKDTNDRTEAFTPRKTDESAHAASEVGCNPGNKSTHIQRDTYTNDRTVAFMARQTQEHLNKSHSW